MLWITYFIEIILPDFLLFTLFYKNICIFLWNFIYKYLQIKKELLPLQYETQRSLNLWTSDSVTLYELEKQYSQISHENNSRKYQASLSISPEKSNASSGVEVQEAVSKI